jgi:hypothetical protein
VQPLRVEPYSADRATVWETFVTNAKNGVFLFRRDYVEYHADRFDDASLLVFKDDAPVALLPASRAGATVLSHGGLTFGGFVTGTRMRQAVMLDVFRRVLERLAADQVERLVYKPVPHIYHSVPAEEDLYALYENAATLVGRDTSSAIRLDDRPPFSKGRKWSIKRALAADITVTESREFEQFMAIEEAHLQTAFGVQPTHTAAEMRLLADRFPSNVRLFAAYRRGDMVAGVLVYESRHVAHAQYIAATDEGKEISALDAIIHMLLSETYREKRWFDFGISSERERGTLNEGLAGNKESFGGRAVMYDVYEVAVP